LSQKNLPELALKKAWVLTMGVRVNQTPLLAGSGIVFASTANDVLASSRYLAKESFHLETSGTISAGLAQYGDTVYVPLTDASLLAVEANLGRTLWRFTADSGIMTKPAVIGNDIFVVSLMGQLYRVDRETGVSDWRDSLGNDRFVAGIRSFVAANDRHVYAIDSTGQLAVIDRARGELLRRLNTSEYTYAMANDETDRVYLASNSGALVCLHDRSIGKPKAHPKAKATGSVNKGDGANDLFKPSDQNKPKKPVDFPGSKGEKAAGDDKGGDDKPMDDKPKTKPKAKPKGKPKDDMPKDDDK
jgi:outer membrane protein assembly factor BamB